MKKYLLKMTEAEHTKIKTAAVQSSKSINDFILDAVNFYIRMKIAEGKEVNNEKE